MSAAPATTAASTSRPAGVVPMFIGLMTAMLLSALDQTMFATALPTIVGELGGVDLMLWVTTAYILAATITMPIYGKFGDLVGRKGLLLIAIGIFIAGSVVGALASDMPELILGRAIQGIGGGGLMVLAQAIIADVIPARERGRYMGFLGSVFALSSVLGPLLGGWSRSRSAGNGAYKSTCRWAPSPSCPCCSFFTWLAWNAPRWCPTSRA